MKALSAVVLLLIIQLQSFALEDKTYCIKSNAIKTRINFDKSSCVCQSYTDWSTLTSNSSRHLKSYAKLCLSSGTFNLTTKLIINNMTNISLIGINSTSIKCFNNSFIAISNTVFVEIQNVKLDSCGGIVQQYKIKDHNVEGYACTALFIQNVRSLIISNVVYKNSYGHSIVGINLKESSVLQSVSIFYVTNNSDVKELRMGGIILIFNDEIANYSDNAIQPMISIKHCRIYYMNKVQVQTYYAITEILNALAFGFAFYQQKYSVSIKIMTSNIKNVEAQSHPLVFIIYNSNNTNIVTILNSNLSLNSMHSIIKINELGKSCKPASVFESENNTFHGNVAEVIYSITKTSPLPSQTHIRIISTVFTHNEAKQTFWLIKSETRYSYETMIKTDISRSIFAFNRNVTIEFYNAGNVTLLDNNLFSNVNLYIEQSRALIRCIGTRLIFEGCNKFSNNNANLLLELSDYVIMREHAIIDITQNIAVTPDLIKGRTSALISFNNSNTEHLCMFQFYSSHQGSSQSHKRQTDHFAIVFKENQNYSALIYGTQLNSCYWLKDTINFGNLTTGEVMRSVLHFSNNTSNQIVRKQVCLLCYCENGIAEDCIKDRFGPINPGQTIPINLKQIPPYSNSTSIYYIAQPHEQLHDIEQCTVKSEQLNWLQPVYNSCTSIFYRIYSKSHNQQCYISFKATYPDDSIYIYYININRTCPLGFNLIDGSCECHAKLQAAFPSISCDINTQTIIHPGKSWIGLSKQGDILYVKFCAPAFCNMEPCSVHLNSSAVQCNYDREGIACGECPPELSAAFGSLRCIRCSNQWLFLIPVFMLAGLLLVILLFGLNITVVDGKINGFLLYVNGIIANMHAIFPPSASDIETVMLLMNLDLGIETCFYNGMTEYAKTWLQFAFPSYLLLIVAALAVASRYFSSVERLTRRRVIPVITTIFLLTYGKLLLVASKVLLSHTTVYSLSNNVEKTIWMWDTSIPLFGIEFCILFSACLLLILVILLPLALFLLFPRLVLRIRLLAKYLKPYLDACQAPLKDNCRYFLGLELLFRWITFAIGSRLLKSQNKRLAMSTSLLVFFLVYTCIFKPFKSPTNNALYISYLINLECLIILITYSDFHITETYYIILLHLLLFAALAQFVGTVLYYLYINRLQKIKRIKLLAVKLKNIFPKFVIKRPPPSPVVPVGHYVQLQEELIVEDLV